MHELGFPLHVYEQLLCFKLTPKAWLSLQASESDHSLGNFMLYFITNSFEEESILLKKIFKT